MHLTGASINMLTDLENCFQFINDNIEFTFVGWYNRGVINDKSIVDSRNIDDTSLVPPNKSEPNIIIDELNTVF